MYVSFCLCLVVFFVFFFFSSRRRHTRCLSDWSSDVCSSDLSTRIASHSWTPYSAARRGVRCPRVRSDSRRHGGGPRSQAARRRAVPRERGAQIGRASCRGRGEIAVGGVALKSKTGDSRECII